MSSEDLDEMRNECTIEVMTYESLFEFNSLSVQHIEKHLILKLLALLSPNALPGNIYKISTATATPKGGPSSDLTGILNALNTTVFEEFKEMQDA